MSRPGSRRFLRNCVAGLAVAVVLALVVGGVVASGSQADRHTKFVTPHPAPQPIMVAAQWDKPQIIDGYMITITKPVDESDHYPCPGCATATLTAVVVLIAGAVPLDPRGIRVRGVDGNYSRFGVTAFGTETIPPGSRHIETVQLHPAVSSKNGALTVVITTGSGSEVVWTRQPVSG